MIKKLQYFPLHVFALIFFFISHGYAENIGLIPFADMVLYFLTVSAISGILLFLFKKNLSSFLKAGVITTLLLSFFLFFGVIQNFLKGISFLTGLSRYRVLIPVFIVSIIIIYLCLKRSNSRLLRLTLYLNTVFIAFILIDLASIAYYSWNNERITKNEPLTLSPCKDCKTPDIYLIVLDEYSGHRTLKNYFRYDNSNFEHSLQQRGFFVASRPFSNYTSTPISMASLFEMQYITWKEGRKTIKAQDYTFAANLISNSAVIGFLKEMKYEIFNCSIFDIVNQPSRFKANLLPLKLKLITSKTLWATAEKDLVWNLHSSIATRFNWVAKRFQNDFKEGNRRLLSVTKEALGKRPANPKFVYTHLMMPHLPYLYDSLGNETTTNFYDPKLSRETLDRGYVQYLAYTNKVIYPLIIDILQKTSQEAVIVLMSDHGCRGLTAGENWSENDNLNAVFVPGEDYRCFYDSISNVNQFRTLLKTLFKQDLPLLPDSCVHLN